MTAAQQVCLEEVGEPPGYWHWHRCGRRAKWLVLSEGRGPLPVCGTHVKRHQRRGRTVTPLTNTAEGSA